MLIGHNRFFISKNPRTLVCFRSPLKCALTALISFSILTLLHSISQMLRRDIFVYDDFSGGELLDFSMTDNITGFDRYIVPNIVHFIKFDRHELTFEEMISIKAAHVHQNPDKIMIHCNCNNLSGKYWKMVENIACLELHYLEKPTEIFGKKFSQVFHASDVARMQTLMRYGGIFLDGDTYVVKSLDFFRKFEMTLGSPFGEYLGTQVLIAHKDARFIPRYINTYHQYNGSRWYYNAGELPTKSILWKYPHLVHRVPIKFGVHSLVSMLYKQNSSEWKEFYTIHLLSRHKSYMVPNDYINDFDEENIKTYNKTFGKMARLVLYGSENFVE